MVVEFADRNWLSLQRSDIAIRPLTEPFRGSRNQFYISKDGFVVNAQV